MLCGGMPGKDSCHAIFFLAPSFVEKCLDLFRLKTWSLV